MIKMIETKVGNFELLKNEKDAFELKKFEDKYLAEYFDKYDYLVGDLSDDILRLKGFSTDPKSKSYFHFIPEYLVESCPYNCRYYILKRIKEKKLNDVELFQQYQADMKETVKENEAVEQSGDEEPKRVDKPHKKYNHRFKKYHNKKKANNNEPRTNN